MQRKTEVIIAIIIIVALAVLLFLWFNRSAAPLTTPTKKPAGVTATNNVTPTPETATPVTAAPASASTVARVFVERFGSYSTESGYTNIDDVMTLTTTDLQGRLRSLVEEAQKNVEGQYYGVSTRLMGSKTEVTSDTAITFLVSTQRQESFDSPANTSVRYQDIRISLVKSGENWLISDFTWL
jgi:hypothetical protein